MSKNAVTKRHSWPENKILDVWFLWPCVLPVGERPAFLDKEAFRRLVPLDTALMMDWYGHSGHFAIISVSPLLFISTDYRAHGRPLDR